MRRPSSTSRPPGAGPRSLVAVAVTALVALFLPTVPASAAPITLLLQRIVVGPVPGATASLTVALNGGSPVAYPVAVDGSQTVPIQTGDAVVVDRLDKEAGWVYEAECFGPNFSQSGVLPIAFTAPTTDLTCSIREEPERYLVVQKQTDPPGTAETTPFPFSVQATWRGGSLDEEFTLLDGQSRAFALPAGAQATVVEDAPGWDTSHDCFFIEGEEVIPRSSGGASATLDFTTYGARCTFINAEPDPEETVELTVTRNVFPTELGAEPIDVQVTPEGRSPIVLPLAHGDTATTTIPSYVTITLDWVPTAGTVGANVTVNCYEGDGFFISGSPPLTFEGDAQDITCDIFESFDSGVTVHKVVEPHGAGEGVDFPFVLSAGGEDVPFTLHAGESRTFGLARNANVTIVEDAPGWAATHVCTWVPDGPPVTVSEGGEEATFEAGSGITDCTFTNTEVPGIDLRVTRYVFPAELGEDPVDVDVSVVGHPAVALPLPHGGSAITTVPRLATVAIDWDPQPALTGAIRQVSCAADDFTWVAGGPPPFTFTTPTVDLHCDVYELLEPPPDDPPPDDPPPDDPPPDDPPDDPPPDDPPPLIPDDPGTPATTVPDDEPTGRQTSGTTLTTIPPVDDPPPATTPADPPPDEPDPATIRLTIGRGDSLTDAVPCPGTVSVTEDGVEVDTATLALGDHQVQVFCDGALLANATLNVVEQTEPRTAGPGSVVALVLFALLAGLLVFATPSGGGATALLSSRPDR